MQKYPYVFPIVGGRKVEHFQANLEALDISLSREQIQYLDSIAPYYQGFPYNYFVSFHMPACTILYVLTLLSG